MLYCLQQKQFHHKKYLYIFPFNMCYAEAVLVPDLRDSPFHMLAY